MISLDITSMVFQYTSKHMAWRLSSDKCLVSQSHDLCMYTRDIPQHFVFNLFVRLTDHDTIWIKNSHEFFSD